MQSNAKIVCRFCLNLVHSANVHLLNEVMREMLSLLTIKLDLNVNDHPSVCGMCLGFLDDIYLFKSKCLYTEDIISARVETNSKISLSDILIEIENKHNVHIGEDEVVCRLCMKIPPNCSYIALGEPGENTCFSRDMIQIHLPEMDLNITKKPIICDSCHECLKSYVSFATKCLAVEEKIKMYCDFQKSSGPVDLACVRQFTEDKTFDLQTRLSKDLVIKEEESSVMVKVEKDAEDYISEGHFVDCGNGSELLLKNEEIDIKSENDEMSEEMGESVPSGSSNKSGKSGSLKRKRQLAESPSKGRNHFSSDNHMVRQRGLTETYGCHECTFKTVKKPILVQHMLIHKDKSEVEMHKCENCEFETKYKRSIMRHMLKHRDPNAKRKFKCDKCPYETDVKADLRKHILRHKEKLEVHKCENCEYETMWMDNLLQHMLKHHDPKAGRKFKCGKCLYETDFMGKLRTHNLKHKNKSEVEMYKCENCEFETRYKSSMIKHMLKHSNPKAKRRFKCDKCPYETNFMSSLRTHSQVHKDKSELEMYKCDNCEYETRLKGILVQHMAKKHRDPKAERKFKCDKCPYATDFMNSLRSHNLIHKDKSEVEMYKCEKCKSEYRHKRSLNMHMRRKHCDPKA